MNNQSTKPPVWINIPDLMVQVGIVVWAFCLPNYKSLMTLMFWGGGWQLFSHFIHYILKFSYQPKTMRRRHFGWSLGTICMLVLGLVLLPLGIYIGLLCLLLGVVLYISYMIICMRELVISNDEPTIIKHEN